MPEGAKPGEPMTIDQLENYNKQLLAQLDEEEAMLLFCIMAQGMEQDTVSPFAFYAFMREAYTKYPKRIKEILKRMYGPGADYIIKTMNNASTQTPR